MFCFELYSNSKGEVCSAVERYVSQEFGSLLLDIRGDFRVVLSMGPCRAENDRWKYDTGLTASRFPLMDY